ncbi:monocarboxylate transporter [Aspergillus pseudocaelatus]|uniref:Monocarboxylate transporter n=1 Tax=Aspergillus pseudocaelatus TaxID=1825620 RepID=A0ABQ6WT13_9EURO|nr:monocarboxylate transporter [Aspergillus pseudocaelatus]
MGSAFTQTGLRSCSDSILRMVSSKAVRNRATLNADDIIYPAGGLKSWLYVTGSFLGLVASLRLLNSMGVFQAYLDNHQLKGYGSGSTGWICSYLHFMLSIGVAGGVGTSLTFTPAISAVSHFFYEKSGIATGIAASGGSIRGVIMPLALQNVFDKVGFAWATRPFSREHILPDFGIFLEIRIFLTTMSIFFIEWGLFVPLTYIISYGFAEGISTEFSYQLLAIFNAGSCFGRCLPGFLADRLGRFNTLIVRVALCLIFNACLWLPGNGNVPMIVVYCCLFGFASGSNISLTPVCVGQLCKTEHYGRYYAMSYTIVSFGTLTGVPIAGEILSRCGGEYWGLIMFTICCYAAGLARAIAVKVIQTDWRDVWWSVY